MDKTSTWSVIRHTLIRIRDMMKFVMPWWYLYIPGMLIAVSQNLFINYYMASFTKQVLDIGLHYNQHSVSGLLANYGIVMVITLAILVPAFYAYLFASAKGSRLMQCKLLERIQRLPVQDIEDSHTGDFVDRINTDIRSAFQLYSWSMMNLITTLVTGIGGIIVICMVDWRMVIASITAGVIGLFVNLLYAKPTKQLADQLVKTQGQATEKMTDMIAGATVSRVFGIRNRVLKRYVDSLENIYRIGMRQVWLNTTRGFFDNGIAGAISMAGRLLFGLWLVSTNALSLPDMAFCFTMGNGITYMISGMGQMMIEFQRSVAAADRVMNVLQRDEEPYRENKKTPVWDENAPAIEMDDITFAYRRLIQKQVDENDHQADKLPEFVSDPSMPNVVNQFSMRINRNERVALVGESGSGKTTILKLMMSFYPIKQGKMRFAGVSYDQMPLDAQCAMMAYVPQDSFLFEGTIAENISYGSVELNPSIEDIESAAKAAYAHDFIMALPDGYQTMVGERGAKLSGGQRQRVAIARALLRDAPILLLDEATSALDSESEAEVQKALDRLMENRTTIVVAHRLSTVQNADRILVMRNGTVIEEGNHETLLRSKGHYKRMYETQFAS